MPAFFMELPIPRLADVNIAVSETTKRRMVVLLKVNPNKIVVIPNGMDLNKFKRIQTGKKYGRILYAGRLESHKCVDQLIFAYKRLKMVYSSIELIIVGKGPMRKYLQDLSRRLNLDVIFYDPLPYDNLALEMLNKRYSKLIGMFEAETQLKENYKILDVGCGPTYISRLFTKGEKYGIDPLLMFYARIFKNQKSVISIQAAGGYKTKWICVDSYLSMPSR